MNYGSMYGSHKLMGTWNPHVQISSDSIGMVPPESLIVDPYLPTVAIDPLDPAGAVVIPRGRFVSIGYSGGRGASNHRFARTDTGSTTLTIHDGKNLTPVGFSINQMFKADNDFMVDHNETKFKRGFVAEVPFVQSINDAHGTLKAGDFLTGYWGSTTSTSVTSYLHRGKPVKWNPRKVYATTASASAIVELPAAIYPGIEPRIVAVYAAGSLLTTATAATTFDTNLGNWVSTFTGTGSATVTTVIYDYGQDYDQVGGEVLRLQSLTDMQSTNNFLKWVEMGDNVNFPPAFPDYPVTSVGTGSDPDTGSGWETPSTVVAGVSYRVANYPVSVKRPFLVAFKGTLVDTAGVTQTYTSWTILPYNAIQDSRGYFNANYHTVNWRTGLIELASNVTSVSAIKVLYSYITDPRDGAASWGDGVEMLTDGRNVSAGAGVPSYLNFADVVAALRLIVK